MKIDNMEKTNYSFLSGLKTDSVSTSHGQNGYPERSENNDTEKLLFNANF